MMKNGTPTMKDVAQEAGVAIATVSKYFSGGSVKEQYRIKVEQAAKKLGYTVNRTLKPEKKSSPSTVCLVIPTLAHPFFGTLATHICQALAEKGAAMQVYLTGADKDTEHNILRSLSAARAEGVIGLVYSTDIALDETIPFVTVDCRLGEAIPCVASDNFNGGELMVRKLSELGCKNLAFFRTGSVLRSEPDKRGDGFKAECRSRQIPYEVCWVDQEDTMQPFVDFLNAHLHDGKLDFDGLGCSTDYLALKTQEVLESMGIRVPEDVQIIGYDGCKRFVSGNYLCSTIVQPIEQIAQVAVDTLFNIGSTQAATLVCLPVSYAAGGTTKEQV